MGNMDYIEYKNNGISYECTWKYDGKKIEINPEKGKKILKYLNEYNFEYQTGIIDGKKIVRFYGVSNEIIKLLNENKKNTKSRVTRINKYQKLVVPIAGITATALIFGSAVYYMVKGIVDGLKFRDEEPIPTIAMEIKEKEVNIAALTENVVEEPKIADKIVIADSYFDFEFEDRSQSEKANKTKELYYNIIDKYSKMYGLPTNLMVAVATQECGVHQTTRSTGGGFGLFQIQVGDTGWNWIGNNVTAYNFETGKDETLTIGKTASGELKMNMLADLEYNVKVGCMIMSSELKRSDYDIICALQSYNSGNQPRKLKRNYGEDWVNHRESVPGDDMYLEHVLSYVSPENNVLQYFDSNNNRYAIAINNVYNRSKALS